MNDRAWQRLVLGTAILLAVTVYFLLYFGRLSPTLLWLMYFAYAILASLLLHFIIFARENTLAKRGDHLSKRLPKYLEYAYTVVIAVSLLQIFVYAPRVADYVTWLKGDETYVANQIKNVADSYLKDECINLQTKVKVVNHPWWHLAEHFYFTEDYCEKLTRIANASDIKEYIIKSVVPDRAFVNHIIEDYSYPDQQPNCDLATKGAWEIDPLPNCWPPPPADYSPMPELVKDFEIVHQFVSIKASSNSAGSNRLSWIGMLLLPIGIALRVVKTSVELFVPLQ